MSTSQTKIFVADDVSDTGLQPLRDAGFVVEKETGLAPEQLRNALADADGLVVRHHASLFGGQTTFIGLTGPSRAACAHEHSRRR